MNNTCCFGNGIILNFNLKVLDNVINFNDKHEFSIEITDSKKKQSFIDSAFQPLTKSISKSGIYVDKNLVVLSKCMTGESLILNAKVLFHFYYRSILKFYIFS